MTSHRKKDDIIMSINTIQLKLTLIDIIDQLLMIGYKQMDFIVNSGSSIDIIDQSTFYKIHPVLSLKKTKTYMDINRQL